MAMTVKQSQPAPLAREDQRLVDLLATVLVDPNLHTDTRLRLHEEITEMLRGAHHDLHGPAGPDMHRRALETHEGRLPGVLASVLVDPNLHTDTRMRLHQQISEMLAGVERGERS